jgi:ADP-heptose:LPS heptosyltransferase
MHIIAKNGLLGDFIGVIPTIIELSKTVDKLTVDVVDSTVEIFNMIPKKYNITRADTTPKNTAKYDISHAGMAFSFAHQGMPGGSSRHMTQCYQHVVGLPTPNEPVRPDLEVPDLDYTPKYDFILSPFSRSLQEHSKWQKFKWQLLVNKLSDKTFSLFGNSTFDDKNYILAPNVTPEFDRPFTEVASIMKKSKGLIAVNTGTQHLSYAIKVPTILLSDQGGLWGRNPEAIWLQGNVQNISVEQVIETIRNIGV